MQCITHCLPLFFSPDPIQLHKTHRACSTSTTGLKPSLDSVLSWHKPQPKAPPNAPHLELLQQHHMGTECTPLCCSHHVDLILFAFFKPETKRQERKKKKTNQKDLKPGVHNIANTHLPLYSSLSPPWGATLSCCSHSSHLSHHHQPCALPARLQALSRATWGRGMGLQPCYAAPTTLYSPPQASLAERTEQEERNCLQSLQGCCPPLQPHS